MRLVCILFTFENSTEHTDGRTDTTSYRDATAYLKSRKRNCDEETDKATLTMRLWLQTHGQTNDIEMAKTNRQTDFNWEIEFEQNRLSKASESKEGRCTI